MLSLFKSEDVEFFCAEEDYDVIPPPIPSRKFMPEWYKHLSPKINDQNKLENSTIKRCAPFLDAMTMGWIIPLCADVEFVTGSDTSHLTWKHTFYKGVIEEHKKEQIKGHPEQPKPPMKWLNYIYIKIPKNHTAIFMPPLNRANPHFECFSGAVDAGYLGQGDLEYINFPFFFKTPNYTGIIKAGTPLVQMIVVPNKSITRNKVKWRKIAKQELETHQRTKRRLKSQESHYRDNLWKPK